MAFMFSERTSGRSAIEYPVSQGITAESKGWSTRALCSVWEKACMGGTSSYMCVKDAVSCFCGCFSKRCRMGHFRCALRVGLDILAFASNNGGQFSWFSHKIVKVCIPAQVVIPAME